MTSRWPSHIGVFSIFLMWLLLGSQFAAAQTQDLSEGEDPIKLFERGQNAHAKNDYKAAIELYDAAIKLKPEFPEAEFQRAMALLAANRFLRVRSGHVRTTL